MSSDSELLRVGLPVETFALFWQFQPLLLDFFELAKLKQKVTISKRLGVMSIEPKSVRSNGFRPFHMARGSGRDNQEREMRVIKADSSIEIGIVTLQKQDILN